MLDPIPQHPYPSGLAVHDAAETSEEARTRGTARVVAHRPHSDGTFTYVVEQLAGGTRMEWASYFTIPAGLWAMTDGRGPDDTSEVDAESVLRYAEAQVSENAEAAQAPQAPQASDAPEAELESSVPSER